MPSDARSPTPVDQLDLPDIDLLNAPTRAERRRLIVQARASGAWLVRTPAGYLVISYEDAVAILRDRRFHNFSSRLAELAGAASEEFRARQRPSILAAEGDEHARLRRLVAPAFTPKAADRWRPAMREVMNRLVDTVAPDGRCEAVSDICDPYPIPIICRLLGAPEEDWKLFSRWAADLLRIFNFNFAQDWPLIVAAQDEMSDYMRDLIERRRQDPADDLLTDLIAAEEAGDRLSPQELESMAVSVLVAGTDTTRNQLACTMALFTEHPDQWAKLADRPELAPRAVEESLRFLGAVAGTGRFASEDIEYRDVLFPKDVGVSTSFVAANLDPSVFPDPETFDITRQPAQAHLTFGSGIHFCLGAWLARAELQEALPILAARLPELAVDGAIAWKPNAVGIWGPARLPLTFRPS
jgi:cytochrome P450